MNHADTLRQMADLIDENEAQRIRISVLELELQQAKSRPVKEEKEWYTPKEAAEYIGRSTSFLDKDHMESNKSPEIPFTKQGSRTIRYRKSDLDTWLSSKQKA
ncbi:MAG: hypothetical protein A2X82_20160 [Geobacteraceae bacterium GWC2_55_20]|nr:MAG: hypothetical protein A2X82_20160 [Geobacteraceae bacterium GWC2_55_20]OGU24448.1 MAG: hypothetical protein A2X85_09400 [Geobacteraceae bacterium GWF2_54_21]